MERFLVSGVFVFVNHADAGGNPSLAWAQRMGREHYPLGSARVVHVSFDSADVTAIHHGNGGHSFDCYQTTSLTVVEEIGG